MHAALGFARAPPGPAEAALRALALELVDLLLPPRCAGCGRGLSERRALCARCDGALPRIEAGACPGCQDAGAPAPAARCAACAADPGPLDACCAAVWFEGAAAVLVRRFKYAAPGLAGLDPAAEAVAFLLAREAAARVPGPAPRALVPIPLHPARIRARGFAPAAVLAPRARPDARRPRAGGAPPRARYAEPDRPRPPRAPGATSPGPSRRRGCSRVGRSGWSTTS